jgi:hypothetical protein
MSAHHQARSENTPIENRSVTKGKEMKRFAGSVVALTLPLGLLLACAKDAPPGDAEQNVEDRVTLEGAFEDSADPNLRLLVGRGKYVVIGGTARFSGTFTSGRGKNGAFITLSTPSSGAGASEADAGVRDSGARDSGVPDSGAARDAGAGTSPVASPLPAGSYDFLEVGKNRSLLLRGEDGTQHSFKRVKSYCVQSDDCKIQGLKACSGSQDYVCGSNACSCGTAPASDGGTPRDAGSVPDSGPRDAGRG